jgi:hypothetical protein
MLWIDERSMPEELIALIDNPYTPEDLRKDSLAAQVEIEHAGAVGYVTKANIERGLYHLSDAQKERIQSYYDQSRDC